MELKTLCEKQNNLSKEMEIALVDFVNQNGGSIETKKENCDIIWAYCYFEDEEKYQECIVEKVKVENNCLLIDVCRENYDELECYSVSGGMCLYSATLYNLCDCITEYVWPNFCAEKFAQKYDLSLKLL